METTTTIIHPPKVSGYEKKWFFLGYQLFATNLRNTLKRNKLHSARFECNEVSFLFRYCLKKLLVPMQRLQAVT